MVKIIVLSVVALVAVSVNLASADDYDNCIQTCANESARCIEDIHFADETGIKEAKAACANEKLACKRSCDKDESKAIQEAAENRLRKEAEEAEKKRQEQQETLNGTIKVITFGD